MFRSSRKSFRVYYYISSLLPVYLFIVMFMISIRVNHGKELITNIWKLTSSYKLVFYMFIFLLLISVFCLLKTRRIIEESKEYSVVLGTLMVEFKNQYNSGFRESILIIALPMVSTISIEEYPLPTLMMILVFQIFIFFLFLNSSDFFPNLSLLALGYSVFIVDQVNSQGSNLKYVFGKTSDIDSIVNNNHQQFQVVEIGEPNYSNDVGVINEQHAN